MKLDNEILGELNRRTQRYKYFKIFSLPLEDLEIIKQQDVDWIKRTCESEDYDPKKYLYYYLGRLR